MSDYIHFEIQVKIMKMLPVKSLIQFRSVSKSWKSLIDSSEFIADYTKHHQQDPLLLIEYTFQSDQKYISLLDDDNFHQHNFTTTPPPMSVKVDLKYALLVGSSHGLFCYYVYYYKQHKDDDDCGTDMAVIWNPSIRKSVAINVPRDSKFSFETADAFGVCPITFDPTIVKIKRVTSIGIKISWSIKVFTLSSRDWKNLCSDFLRDSIQFRDSYVDIDGFIYWHAFERIIGTRLRYNNLIMSFDMSSHEFKELYLPDSLADNHHSDLFISKVRDSLVVLEYYTDVSRRLVWAVWMMMDHYGVSNSFTKLYTIEPIDLSSVRDVLGFTNSGAPIIEKQNDDDEDSSTIAVYEIDSQHINEIGIYGVKGSFSVNSYKETLIMLNQPDSIPLLEEV